MQKRVFNLIIVDESGSMSCIENQALAGMNETLSTIVKMDKIRRNRQTLWGGCTDANPKLLLNDT